MRIFVTGSTGFVEELIRPGHHVFGLARSDVNAAALSAAGASVVRGALEDLVGLHKAAADSDGLVHTAHNHDFVNVDRDAAATEDHAAIKAMASALVGTNHP